MIQITFAEVQAGVAEGPNGTKLIMLQDPQSGIQVVVPFTEEGAREIAAKLTGGVVVASNGDLAALPFEAPRG